METTILKKTSKLVSIMFLVALLTAFFSELKIMPFEDAPFRFGLGSIIFFFALLIRPLPIFATGLLTAFTVVGVRTILDFMFYDAAFLPQLIEHLPSGLFYIVFALCFHFISFDEIKNKPLILGFCATAFEVIANTIEHITTAMLLSPQLETANSFILFIIVGLLRSFFVVGVFNMITLTEQKNQIQQLLKIHSELYVETLYLQKSMNQVEQLTANSYQLYKKVKPLDASLGKDALILAQEMHEIKKDHERIYAGLSKITKTKTNDYFLLSDLLGYIIEANKNYALLLNKSIHFTIQSSSDFHTKKYISLMAILNNLIANAIEAIQKEGQITLSVLSNSEDIQFIVTDNGSGIDEALLPIIFDVGYTSKYNEQGQASTGIGLSHTKTIIENLHGSISVESDEFTTFTVTIPTDQLREERT
jgi:two-component sensor histidine kinase